MTWLTLSALFRTFSFCCYYLHASNSNYDCRQQYSVDWTMTHVIIINNWMNLLQLRKRMYYKNGANLTTPEQIQWDTSIRRYFSCRVTGKNGKSLSQTIKMFHFTQTQNQKSSFSIDTKSNLFLSHYNSKATIKSLVSAGKRCAGGTRKKVLCKIAFEQEQW